MIRISLFFLLLTTYSLGQNVAKEQLDHFVSDPAFKYASISFEIKDLEENKSILSYDANRTLITASTAKLFSTATALSILGPDYKSQTRLYADGEIDSSGVLHGNLLIRGGGDPSFGSKYFNAPNDRVNLFHDWVIAIKKAGIKKIDGSIIADASEFGYQGVPDGWQWIDMGNYYGAGPSGLTIYDNLIEYTFTVPGKIGSIAQLDKIAPEFPGLDFESHITASENKGDNAYIYGAPYQNHRFGQGTLPAGSTAFKVKGSMPDPELMFAQELQKTIEDQGILISDHPSTTRSTGVSTNDNYYNSKKLIHTHYSTDLIDIIKETNYRSINLFAEHMITMIGYHKSGRGTSWEGLKQLENYWAGKIDLNGIRIADGSGLSRSNAISAHHFVSMLSYMYAGKYGELFKNTLPISGKSGTLLNVCRGQKAEGRIQAKSGSINGVRSYAGYIRGDSGKLYSFALIVNNADCGSSILKRKMEVLFNSLATL